MMQTQKLQPAEINAVAGEIYVDPETLTNVHPLHSATVRPSVETERAYRDALGRFGTGVTLITANTPNGPIGMTVNSFASVSLDPALVLWSIAKKSGRYEPFKNATYFAIHVLAENQHDLAMEFAKNATGFDEKEWQIGEESLPLAKRALARFECVREAVHDGGDHSILVGRVLRFSQRPGKPLLFSSGEFGTFTNQT